MCSDVLLIELECNHCKVGFYICRKCYRGHVCCSNSCRRETQIFLIASLPSSCSLYQKMIGTVLSSAGQ
jgi:hypothetical protein